MTIKYAKALSWVRNMVKQYPFWDIVSVKWEVKYEQQKLLIEILRTFWTDMFKKVEINSKNENWKW